MKHLHASCPSQAALCKYALTCFFILPEFAVSLCTCIPSSDALAWHHIGKHHQILVIWTVYLILGLAWREKKDTAYCMPPVSIALRHRCTCAMYSSQICRANGKRNCTLCPQSKVRSVCLPTWKYFANCCPCCVLKLDNLWMLYAQKLWPGGV